METLIAFSPLIAIVIKWALIAAGGALLFNIRGRLKAIEEKLKK